MTIVMGFDTETSGLVLSKEKPSHPNQPFLVQLGVTLWDAETARELSYASIIIHPDSREVPSQASAVHGITTDIATAVGIPLVFAAATFSQFCKVAQVHVGHNIDFDLKVLQAEFFRLSRTFPPVNPRCTKDIGEPILRLPPTERMIAAGMGDKWKSPTLGECWRYLYNEELQGAHDALVDARACVKIFLEFQRRKADV